MNKHRRCKPGVAVTCAVTAALLAIVLGPSSWSLAGAEGETAPAVKNPSTPVATIPGKPSAMATAESGPRVLMTNVLGVEIGESLASAQAKLDPLSEPRVEEPKSPAEKRQEELERTRKSGRKKLFWTLRETEFRHVLLYVNRKDEVTAAIGFLRPERRRPFTEVGDLARAGFRNDTMAAWDVLRPDRPGYRVTARGADQQADTVFLRELRLPKMQPAVGELPADAQAQPASGEEADELTDGEQG